MTRAVFGSPGEWPCARLTYRAVPSAAGPLLEVSIALDPDQVPGEEAQPDAAAAAQVQYAALAGWLGASGEDLNAPIVTVDTGGALMAGPASQGASGGDLSSTLAGFCDEAAGWLASRRGDAPHRALLIAISRERPMSWASDLHQLCVTLAIDADGETFTTGVPPAPEGAATIEAAYENYNGTGGRIRLARREAATAGGAQDLWLWRWEDGGTRVAFRPGELPVFWAPAPPGRGLSSATVDGRRYEDVDLRRWLSTFLTAMESVAARHESARPVRRRIAEAVAQTLVPLWRTAGDLPNAAAAAGTLASCLARDLTAPVTAIVQVPAIVQGSFASGAQPGAAWRIEGEAAGSAMSTPLPLSTAGVPLAAGDPTIEILIGGEQTDARMPMELAFHASRLTAPGAAPLQLVNPVIVGIGELTCPLPRLEVPDSPAILRAEAFHDAPASGPDLAQLWAFTTSVSWTAAPQDALAISVQFNPPDTGISGAPVAREEHVPPVFEALARFLSEWPELAQAFGTPGEPAALDRLFTLATMVAEGLDQRSPTPGRASPAAGTDAPWRYRAEWDAETRLLTLRDDAGTGPPVWPSVAGFSRDPVEPGARSALYHCDAPHHPVTLDLSWGALAARTIRHVRADVTVVRNQRIAPAGAAIDPAFVLSSATHATRAVASPALVAVDPVLLPAAASLTTSLSALFEAVLTMPEGAHSFGEPAGLEALIELSYSFVLAGDLRSTLPVLRARVPLSRASALATARDLAAHASEWHAAVSPSGSAPEFVMSLALYFLEPDAGPEPASRLPEVRLAIDDRAAWWR